jgi:RHS repeat-associated protein
MALLPRGDRPIASAPLLPSLSLPKGGGAIRGLSESLSVNPATGTATLRIPIPTTPGRSGFGPALALQYDSASGNGPYGLGWSLPLPTLTRRTDRGLPRYEDAAGSDTFLLSGGEDLVPALIERPAGWVADAEERTRPDGSVWWVERFRPRTEGPFARIERWTERATGRSEWRSVTRDNVESRYGASAESRISDPADPTGRRIFAWLLCESFDDKGNAIRYEYVAENGDGVDPTSINERHRTEQDRSANRYVKRIHYGNRTPRQQDEDLSARTDWLFEVVFDYGDHDPATPLPAADRSWAIRPDPFSTYRSGFNLRTYRLCRRILTFHHFPVEAVGDECLVRATNLTYTELPTLSTLASMRTTGYIRRQDGTYQEGALPPLAFRYSPAQIDPTVRELDDDSRVHLPYGVDGALYQWVDLDGEGLPGVLTQEGDDWYYRPNQGGGRLGPTEPLPSQPSLADLSGGRQVLIDLAGDGNLDLVQLGDPPTGFFERTTSGDWEPFRPFHAVPQETWSDPNLRFVDLTGDGHTDLLLAGHEASRWYPGLAEAGFGAAEPALGSLTEPALLLDDGIESLYLADMTGDGLADLVRIRNGQVLYRPNLGYGRFGAPVSMGNAPLLDAPDRFDQRRLRLVDTDGTGPTDLIYLRSDGAVIYLNEAGNRWSDPVEVPTFPPVDDLSSVAAVDLLGNGTACLVWSSPLPADRERPLRYIDLFGGGKPHLLTGIVNNLGGETALEYTPSTAFYLADREAGAPWLTRLPFPVQCVSRLVQTDQVTGRRFATEYTYHHGFYDHREREFRGFGRVDRRDAESFENFVASGATNVVEEPLFQPPVLARTWYHTGFSGDGPGAIERFAGEFANPNGDEYRLPVPPLPADLPPELVPEAMRALAGAILRQEVYSPDGSPLAAIPYTITQSSFAVVQVQPRGANRFAVFRVTPAETLTATYERRAADPRLAHGLVLATDELGSVTRSVTVAMGRRTADATLPAAIQAAQAARQVTYTETDFTQDIDRQLPTPAYRLRVPYETRICELHGIDPANPPFFTVADLVVAAPAATAIGYEETPDGTPQKRLLSRTQTRYLADDLAAPLPAGQHGALGLVHQQYQIAFTPALLADLYGGRVTDAMLGDGGYVHLDGDANWWAPTGTAVYAADAADHFYLARGARDPFGNETTVAYDAYDLLPVRTEAPLDAVVTVENDYRLPGPVLVTDPNLNQTAIAVDELGRVTAIAQMGKAGAGEGDSLADPTVRFSYDSDAWMTNGTPVSVRTFAREQHGAANPRWQESVTYTGGAGDVVLSKAQAEPGLARRRTPATGAVEEIDTSPELRWVGSGRMVVNNKGNPVRQYEPYFSVTDAYESARDLVEVGVSPTTFYDPLNRVIRTEFPNGTLTRIEFDSWQSRTFDANDTVLESSWYADRGSPDPAAEAEPADAERRAAWLTASHAGTATLGVTDSLDRAIYVRADNGAAGQPATRVAIDLTGRVVRLFDALDREVSAAVADHRGVPGHIVTAEKGERWLLADVAGQPFRLWDDVNRQFRIAYDERRRPLATFLTEGAAAEEVIAFQVYGERHPQAADRNLRGTVHLTFDQAGMVAVNRYDFTGVPREIDRTLARDYKARLDWSALTGQPSLAAILTAAAPALEAETFTTTVASDALHRPSEVVLPDGTTIHPTYNAANYAETMAVRIRGAGPFTTLLQDQDRDAKGQRLRVRLGNGTTVTYRYDPLTSRLTGRRTVRQADNALLQDLAYVYDPLGNIVQIDDAAQQAIYFTNAVVQPRWRYAYDALYQLLAATGREHASAIADTQRDQRDLPINAVPHVNDAQSVRAYSELYTYDGVGNLLTMQHIAPGGGWTRRYRYAYQDDPADRTNRLSATSLPGDAPGVFSATYQHDGHGNMVAMPHLAQMIWSDSDTLREVDLGGGGRAYYVYGAGGRRLRKVIERIGGRKIDSITLGAFEVERESGQGGVDLERQTVRILDEGAELARIETKTIDLNDPALLDQPAIRYQYRGGANSATLELDEQGAVISYEEFHPFGTSAYRSGRNQAEVNRKRYRFSAKERDVETGLDYFGARYYAPWLGRWTSADPAGFVDGFNLFRFARNNPISLTDPTGRNPQPQVQWIVPENVTTETQFRDWATRTGIQYSGTPTFNAQTKVWSVESWTRVNPGLGGPAQPPNPQPPPAAGQYGSVAPYSQQPPAQYGTPGVPSTRLTENEHVMPGAQLRDMTRNPATGRSDYNDSSYRNDATLRVERELALNKTHGNRGGPTADNPRTDALRQSTAQGQGINYRDDVFEASRQNSIRSARATNSVVTEQNINRAILEQEGNLFNTHRGSVINSLPQQSFGQRVGEGLRNFGRRILYNDQGYNRFSQTGGTLARTFIPGFIEAEIAALSAPYIVASLGITNSAIVGGAAAVAAAPAATATVVLASAVGGYIVGDIVESAVTEATGSRAAGVAAGTGAGALTGAAIGAAIGSVVPVLGTAVGAAVGAVVGGIAGFIGSFW